MNGVTPTGFITKPLTDILADIEQKEHSDINQALDTSPAQPIGQINGIMAAADRAGWELAESVINATDPDKAEGVFLDIVCSYTGTFRRAATPTRLMVLLIAATPCTVPKGHVISVVGFPAQTFTLDTAVVFPVPGLGSMQTTAPYTATVAGPISVQPNTLTNIVNPITGLTSVANADSGTTGLALETDTQLRIRRVLELPGLGNGSPDGLRADLVTVPGVLEALVQENTGNATDANGNAPHSLRAIVWDGPSPLATNDAIGQTIWRNRAAGIAMNGAVSVTIIDAIGDNRTVLFDRATQKLLYVAVTIERKNNYPGDDAIKNAITAYVNRTFDEDPRTGIITESTRLGREVVLLGVQASALLGGVEDVPALTMGFPTLGATNLAVADTEIAVADPARITITYA